MIIKLMAIIILVLSILIISGSSNLRQVRINGSVPDKDLSGQKRTYVPEMFAITTDDFYHY